MDILINFKYDKIRYEVLNVEQGNVLDEYTSNCYTEKYIFYGAPLMWNPITTA